MTVENEFSRLALLIDGSSDFGLHEVLLQLRSMIEQLKADGTWANLKATPEAQLVVDSLKRRHRAAAEDDSLANACLYALHEAEAIADQEFVIESLTAATRRVKRADHHLFAALRLALLTDLLTDEEYLDAVGGEHEAAMSSFDTQKHIRVAEKILHARGIGTNVP